MYLIRFEPASKLDHVCTLPEETMEMKTIHDWLLVLGLLVGNGQAIAHDHGDTYGDQLGTVHFPVSCNEVASRHMERGVALLHHMTYDGAEASFAAATEADPDCAMGYWGKAMTFIHPLWADVPDEATLKQGWTLVSEAKARGQKTKREQAYIAVLGAYYKDGWTREPAARLASFDQGWRQLHEHFPDDLNAASFYALAHMATADPSDKTYQKQREAGATGSPRCMTEWRRSIRTGRHRSTFSVGPRSPG